MVEVAEGKCPPILRKIQADGPGHIGKSSVSVVCEENITLESAPGGIGADEFINGAPALFILRSELGFHGRISNHLPPKETVQVVTRGTRDHAIRDVKIGKGVMVKIPGVAAPRPTSHFDSGGSARIAKNAVIAISKQGIATGMFAIERSDFFGRSRLKLLLHGNPLSGRRPHVGDIQILATVVVVVKPTHAHAGTDILNSRL